MRRSDNVSVKLTNPYCRTACKIGDTAYIIKGAELTKEGTTTGPTYGLGFYIPENPLGTLGAIIPLLAALGLVIASKKNMITLNLEI